MKQLPTRRESLTLLCALAVWLAVTALCVGLRPEHVWIALLLAALFFASGMTRRMLVALLPFVVFGISYDWMNIVHNYEVNPVDIEGIYNTEKQLFGITTAAGQVVTPNEFFALHTSPVMDFLGGFFYLCWVPVPILFGLYLYFDRQVKGYLHFALVFLFVNFIGALTFSIIGYFYVRSRGKGKFAKRFIPVANNSTPMAEESAPETGKDPGGQK